MTDERAASVHLHIFAAEAEGYLRDLRTQLAALDGAVNAAAGPDLLKPAHALKGTARMLGFEGIAELCHHFEEAATSIQPGQEASLADALPALRQSVDVLERMVSAALAGESISADMETIRRLSKIRCTSEERSAAVRARLGAIATSQPPRPGTIRSFYSTPATTPTGPLSARLRQTPRPIEDVQGSVAFDGIPGSAVPDSVPVPTPELDTLVALAKRLRNGQNALSTDSSLLPDLRSLIERSRSAAEQGDSAHVTDSLTEALALLDCWRKRSIALNSTLQRLERRIRSIRFSRVDVVFGHLGDATQALAQQKGKRARYVLQGGHLEVERELLYGLSGPIIHMIGNAIHHGLEDPRLRQQLGKPAIGTISLSWQDVGRAWRIELADDGAGIDSQRVRHKARQNRLLSDEELDGMDDDQVVQLIFADGISTSSTLSLGGGRGIGLSIVKAGIEKLGGHVHVATRAGLGTTFTGDIPRPRPARRRSHSNR
ncbi:MAG: hypothetical protein EPO21_00175 [Chloroflexota bacterium]|nr:MAG: hypothetical protein EPO21_00175 [Chloroflexota bacterium]